MLCRRRRTYISPPRSILLVLLPKLVQLTLMLCSLDLLRRDSLPESLDTVHPHSHMPVTHHGAIPCPCDPLAPSTAVLPALVWAICGVEDGEGFLAESDEVAVAYGGW